MGLRLFFLPNFPGATFIQRGAFIPDSRVGRSFIKNYCRDDKWQQGKFLAFSNQDLSY